MRMDTSQPTGRCRRLPSFSALRAFEQAATLGSFKDAATALCLSTSAVSHQIRSLEKDLGLMLFDRHAHGVETTQAAREYLRFVQSAFNHLERGTSVVRFYSSS